MNSGAKAEQAASDFLADHGYKILARNWKTPRCEIDIVAEHNQTVYLVEIKYRRTDKQGSGLEYITLRKLEQMRFAAAVWKQVQGFDGDLVLAGIEVSGDDFRVGELVEIS